MTQERRKKWMITPDKLPTVFRRCPKCGRKTEFINSGKFRVNANGSLLDVWLIYRCSVCETSWNLSVYERIEPGLLDREEYNSFLNNDILLAAKYGSSRQLFARNRAELVIKSEGYSIQVLDTSMLCKTGEWNEMEIHLSACLKLRVDVLFAKQLGISRSRVKSLCASGLICDTDGKVETGARLKDGQVFYIRKDWETGSRQRAAGWM